MLKTALLQLYHPNSSQHTGQALVNLPFIDNQTLSVLVTVDSNSESSQEFVKNLLALIRELSLELEIKTSNQPLEKLLGELNNRLPRLPKASHFLTQLNCALVWTNPPEINFTACGRIKIFLIKETNIKEINLEKADNQIFQQILQGELQENDSLLFSTHSLMDYVSQEKIKKTITTLPLTSALAYLENILSKAPQKSCFWALAIKASDHEVNSPSISPEVAKVINQQAPSSLAKLIDTKKNTATILDSPTFAEFSKDQVEKIWSKIKKYQPQDLGQSILQGLKDYGLILIKVFKFLIQLIKIKNWQQLSNQIKIGWQKTINSWQNLNRRQKIIMIILVIILTALTQNLKWQTKLLNNNQIGVQWEQLAQELTTKLAKAEAALIYNGKTEAIEIVKQLENLNLPPNPPLAWQNKFNELKNSLDTLKGKLLNINQTKETVWLDLQSLKQPLTPARLIAAGDERVYLITQEKQMYIFDTENGEKKPPKLSENFPFLPTLTTPISRNKSFIGITNDKKSYNINDFSFEALSWKPSRLAQPTALAYYNNRLYLTDSNNNLLRYTLNGKSLIEETSWLKTPLTQGLKDFGVDGDLYLINNQGGLEKYNRGQKMNWQTDPIDLPLTSARLWVSQTANRLYLFDAAAARLAIFEKTGRLVSQLTSDLFSQTLDWTILEKNKLLLISTKDKIYSWPLP